MRILNLVVCLIWGNAFALPTTPNMTLATGFPDSTYSSSTETTEVVAETTTKPAHTELLSQRLSSSHRQRGRVILATTHMEGSDEWGVTAEEAERSCHRIAQVQVNARTKLDKFPKRTTEAKQDTPLEGHLISVGSSYEVMALSRLLHPLPDGAFWTGGKVVRYRKHSMHDSSYTDHVLLDWADGRPGDVSVLGMTKEDKLQLQEGYIYCLALNLLDNAWQARDCSDKLPYACLVTPKRLRFSNQAKAKSSKKSNSTVTEQAELESKKLPATPPPTKLMHNPVNITESATTKEPEVTEAQTDDSQIRETTAEFLTIPTTTPSILSEELQETTTTVTESSAASTSGVLFEEAETSTESVTTSSSSVETTPSAPISSSESTESAAETATESVLTTTSANNDVASDDAQGEVNEEEAE